MPKVSSGLACPLCDAGGATSELFQLTPETRLRCESGNPQHIWNDIDVLRRMNPRKLAVRPKPDIIQQNHVQIPVSVPVHVAETLKAKYGDRLSINVGSVLSACAEERMVILGAADLNRIEEKLGLGVTSSGELFGRIFALKEEVKQTRNDYETLLRKTGARRGGGEEVQVVLGDWLAKALRMAEESHQDVGEFLSNYLRNSLENDWVTVS